MRIVQPQLCALHPRKFPKPELKIHRYTVLFRTLLHQLRPFEEESGYAPGVAVKSLKKEQTPMRKMMILLTLAVSYFAVAGAGVLNADNPPACNPCPAVR
jgi:hypothetical protein